MRFLAFLGGTVIGFALVLLVSSLVFWRTCYTSHPDAITLKFSVFKKHYSIRPDSYDCQDEYTCYRKYSDDLPIYIRFSYIDTMRYLVWVKENYAMQEKENEAKKMERYMESVQENQKKEDV